VTLNLTEKEYDGHPTIGEWLDMPADAHWNVFQPRPRQRLINMAYNATEKQQSEIAQIELEKINPIAWAPKENQFARRQRLSQ